MDDSKINPKSIFSFRNVLVMILIIIGAIFFYWHDIRPAGIKKDCAQENKKYTNPYEFDLFYNVCLHQNGL